MTDRNILIIGGGIGGLAAAIALRQRGAQVRVLEQAARIAEVGAGLQISPNGMRVIEALGLGAPLADTSVRARAVSLRNGQSGSEVLRLQLSDLPPDQGYFFVHRADLIALLERAARDAGVEIQLDAQVTDVTAGDSPTVTLATGQVLGADLVIGADGLHSVLRPLLNGTAAPFFTRQVAWRAIVPNVSAHPPHARVHMGPGRHLVSYPLRDGRLVNIVAVEERATWAEEGWMHEGDPHALRATFAGFDAEVHRLLGAVQTVHVWGLFRHKVAARWWGDGVALLGDAAHPTLPFLAQGANMALEDAWVLADALTTEPDMHKALERYQDRRHARTQRVIATANGNAWKYHLRAGPVRWAAHLGLRLAGQFAPGRMLRQFDWLYGHDVTR